MAAFVVDASVAAAWFLPDEQSELAEVARDTVTRFSALAPDLILARTSQYSGDLRKAWTDYS